MAQSWGYLNDASLCMSTPQECCCLPELFAGLVLGGLGPELTTWRLLELAYLPLFHTLRQFWALPNLTSSPTFLFPAPLCFPLWTPSSSPISFSQKEFWKRVDFFFLLSLLLNLPYFHFQISLGPCLSSLTKETYPGKDILGKSTDQKVWKNHTPYPQMRKLVRTVLKKSTY